MDVNVTEQVDREVFRTPEWCYASLFKKFPHYFEGKVLDPSAGDGRMGKYLLDHKYSEYVTFCDIRDETEKLDLIKAKYGMRSNYHVNTDFLKWKPWDGRKYNTILTNPPFTLTTAFVEHGWRMLEPNGRIIILQRLNFLGSLRRREFFENNHLQNIVSIGRRPIWELDTRKKNIADTYDYCWLVFSRNTEVPQQISWIYP